MLQRLDNSLRRQNRRAFRKVELDDGPSSPSPVLRKSQNKSTNNMGNIAGSLKGEKIENEIKREKRRMSGKSLEEIFAGAKKKSPEIKDESGGKRVQKRKSGEAVSTGVEPEIEIGGNANDDEKPKSRAECKAAKRAKMAQEKAKVDKETALKEKQEQEAVRTNFSVEQKDSINVEEAKMSHSERKAAKRARKAEQKARAEREAALEKEENSAVRTHAVVEEKKTGKDDKRAAQFQRGKANKVASKANKAALKEEQTIQRIREENRSRHEAAEIEAQKLADVDESSDAESGNESLEVQPIATGRSESSEDEAGDSEVEKTKHQTRIQQLRHDEDNDGDSENSEPSSAASEFITKPWVPMNMREELLRTVKSSGNLKKQITPTSEHTNSKRKEEKISTPKYGESGGVWKKRGGLPPTQFFSSGTHQSSTPVKPALPEVATPTKNAGHSTTRILPPGTTLKQTPKKTGNGGPLSTLNAKTESPTVAADLIKPLADIVQTLSSSILLPLPLDTSPKYVNDNQTPSKSIQNSILKRSVPDTTASVDESQPSSKRRKKTVTVAGSPIAAQVDISERLEDQIIEVVKVPDWEVQGGRVKSRVYMPSVVAGDDGESDEKNFIEESIAFSSSYISGRAKPIKVSKFKFSVVHLESGESDSIADRKKYKQKDENLITICSVARGRVEVNVAGKEFSIGEHGMWRIRGGEQCKVRNEGVGGAILHICEG